MFNYVFKRIEVKYLLNEKKHTAFMSGIAEYMSEDSYGLSTLCNVYYDTENYELIRSSIEKPVFKEKLRLRTYGAANADSTAFIEIKRKYKETVYKRRVSMPLAVAEDYLLRDVYPFDYECQIMQEIEYFKNCYRPIPVLFLAYDRTAYFGKDDPQLRMTVDSGIRYRRDKLSLALGDVGEYLIDPAENIYLLEIKVSEAMPIWLAHLLSENEIYPVSFSKYGEIYKKSLRSSVEFTADGILQNDTINKGELLNV